MIYSKEKNHYSLFMDILMKTPDILKLIDYKITGGSSHHLMNGISDLKNYKLKSETRIIEYQDDSNAFSERNYDGDITINGEEVLRITLRFPQGNGYFIWTNPKYVKFFKEVAKKNNYNDMHAFDDVYYTPILLLEEMLSKVYDMTKIGQCSFDVSYPVEVDTELLKLATTSAKKENMTVEDWLSKSINENINNFKKSKRI